MVGPNLYLTAHQPNAPCCVIGHHPMHASLESKSLSEVPRACATCQLANFSHSSLTTAKARDTLRVDCTAFGTTKYYAYNAAA